MLFIAAAVGLFIMVLVALGGQFFWPTLIFASVCGMGTMVQGYDLADEFFLGCIILGVLLRIFIGKREFSKRSDNSCIYKHEFFFQLLICYLIFQSLRGMVVLGDLRMFRFFFYYGMLGIISFIICHGKFLNITPRKTAIFLVWSGILYFVLYLWQGYFGEVHHLQTYKHIGKFASQGISWVGTAAAVFPLIITIPATLLIARDRLHKHRYLVVFSLIISFYTSVYYDTRSGLLCLFAYMALAVLSGNMNKALIISILLLVIVLIYPPTLKKIQTIFVPRAIQLARSLEFFIKKPHDSDLERMVHLDAACIRVFENPITFFVGDGYYVHRFSLKEPLLQLGSGYNVDRTQSIQTIGFSAFIVDNGILGLFLLVMNLYLTIKTALLKAKGNEVLNRLFAVFIIVFSFLWLAIVNVQGFVLYFLLFMPGGLVIKLCQYDWRASDYAYSSQRHRLFK